MAYGHGVQDHEDGPEDAPLVLHAAGTWISGVLLQEHTQAGATCSQRCLLSRCASGFWSLSWAISL